MEIKCEYIDKDSGCLVSFDGSCCKEECFTYRLLQLLQAKEQECEKLKRQYKELGQCSKRLKEYFEKEKETLSNRFLKLKQILAEIKEIAITGLEGFCPKCSRKECEDNNCIETAIRDILQKISECEVEE